MGRRTVATSRNDKVQLLKGGLLRLQRCITELDALKVERVASYEHQVKPIELSIDDALREAFDDSDAGYRRYRDAASLFNAPFFYTTSYLRKSLKKSVARSKSLLLSAIEDVEQRLAAISRPAPTSVPVHVGKAANPAWSSSLGSKPSVFIAHGHHEQSRAAVVLFLERIGFEAIVLHEQANQGLTIIEKIERHGNVNFAIILLTPDDFGGKVGGETKARARQNVILELGYFIGKLGRDRVCAFKAGDVELPSDVFGVAWEAFHEDKSWQQTLARELEAAGYPVDWKKVALG